MSDPETCAQYAKLILDRHEATAAEADIRSAVRDFLIRTGRTWSQLRTIL